MTIDPRGLVNIGKIISNNPQDYNKEKNYTDEINKRIQELGLTKLISKDGELSNKYKWEFSNELAKKLTEKASQIQWKLTKFNKNDVKNAAEYLSFSTLCYPKCF